MNDKSLDLIKEFLDLVSEGVSIAAETYANSGDPLKLALADFNRTSRPLVLAQLAESADEEVVGCGLTFGQLEPKIRFVRDAVARLRRAAGRLVDELANIPMEAYRWWEKVTRRVLESIVSLVPGGEAILELLDLTTTATEHDRYYGGALIA